MRHSEIIIIGGGLAGLSAAIYLGRARRQTLVVDHHRSMARWEPDVENYLGFPQGIAGAELIRLGRKQARKYGTHFARDEVTRAWRRKGVFHLKGKRNTYACKRLLVATGIFHIPPELPDVVPCLGHSMFFCKDCDGCRVQGKSLAIYGWNNEAVEYALGMLLYSPCVVITTDGRSPRWDRAHQRWLREYKIPVYKLPIASLARRRSRIQGLVFSDGTEVRIQALFTTRGDIYHNQLARGLGARVDKQGQIVVDQDMRTSVARLYAAGCVTPANCQMIIAAGQGATAAQAINRDLLEESLATHKLRRFRATQLRSRRTRPHHRARRVPIASKPAGAFNRLTHLPGPSPKLSRSTSVHARHNSALAPNSAPSASFLPNSSARR
jgi:thioredoxin reductase (NADPH)